MNNERCPFCLIAQKKIPANIIWEDDDLIAFLDIKPINLGHVLIIPKQHFKDLFELPDDIWPQLGPAINLLAQAIKKAVEADGVNIGMNNGQAAGQAVFHAHLHIIPRFDNDGYKNWDNQQDFTQADLDKIAKKILDNLS